MRKTAWVPFESESDAREVLGDVDCELVPFLDNANPPEGYVHFLVLPYAKHPAILESGRDFSALEVVQAQMAGVDNIAPLVPQGVTLCNAAGVHDTATAELGVALALARSRHLDAFARDQHAGAWRPVWGPGLADRQITIIGYGHIGKAIERRLAGFECASITRLARSARTEELDGRPVEVRSIDDLHSVLPDTDVLIVIAPLTEQTRGLVNAETLALLPNGAMVVNMGRGPIVDTDALVEACSSGRITAAMDVIDPEPVPPTHPLRTTPGIFFSPHVGGFTAAFEPRRNALLKRQLQAWVSGEPLANVVEH